MRKYFPSFRFTYVKVPAGLYTVVLQYKRKRVTSCGVEVLPDHSHFGLFFLFYSSFYTACRKKFKLFAFFISSFFPLHTLVSICILTFISPRHFAASLHLSMTSLYCEKDHIKLVPKVL
jgi:hypothetical protein